MSLNNWKMIAEMRSYIFRWRSRFRRRRVCLSSLISLVIGATLHFGGFHCFAFTELILQTLTWTLFPVFFLVGCTYYLALWLAGLIEFRFIGQLVFGFCVATLHAGGKWLSVVLRENSTRHLKHILGNMYDQTWNFCLPSIPYPFRMRDSSPSFRLQLSLTPFLSSCCWTLTCCSSFFVSTRPSWPK